MVFFFSSRRRHTRSDRDWSSDVCSSDLEVGAVGGWPEQGPPRLRSASRASFHLGPRGRVGRERQSDAQGESAELGGRRIIQKKSRQCNQKNDDQTLQPHLHTLQSPVYRT